MKLSKNNKDMKESFLNRWDSVIKEEIATGKDVLQFNLGQPDFACPDFVKSIISEINQRDGNNFYGHTAGTEKARRAVGLFQEEISGLGYSKGEIIITNGAKEALFLAFAALLDVNDEVIVIAPYWPTYVQAVRLLGGRPVIVKSDIDFHPNIEAINRAITNKTKAIVINNPNNPSGVVYGIEELQRIANLAVQNDIFVISDEVYGSTVFDGKKHIPIAIFDGMRDRTITVDGFSKTLSMTGYRLGYAVSSAEIIGEMVKIKSNLNGNTNLFFQMVLEEAILNHNKDLKDFVKHTLSEYSAKRDFLCRSLEEMGITCRQPEGTFYIFALIPAKFRMKSIEFAKYLLEKAGVAVAPGIFFGEDFNDYFRMSFSVSLEKLEGGIERMRKVL